MLDVGDTVAQYRVEARLVVGPAFVYRVRELDLGTPHTLKVLSTAAPADRDRLLAAARIQGRLQHANLVGVTETLVVEGAPALVLEHIDGPSLETWLAEGRISVDIALAMFRGIVTGVGVAHGVGLVHGGLQPSCVLLGRGRSGALVAKVTDFGVSARPSRYFAPEQFRDPTIDDPRVDLWALGCILYELVCGAPAFAATDPVQLRKAIERAAYPDPKGLLAPRSPSRVSDAIRELLQPEPSARIPSCPALWSRLWDVAVPAEMTSEVTQPLDDDGGEEPMDATHVWDGDQYGNDVEESLEEDEPEVLVEDDPQATPMHESPLHPPLQASVLYDSPLHASSWPVQLPQAEAAWIPTPSTVDRRPPAPVPGRSRWWYVGAILVTGVPAGLFALVVAGLVLERTDGGFGFSQAPGRVFVDGDARTVWLEASGRKVPVNRPVPPGRYEVLAAWDDGVARKAGPIQVRAGVETRLRCVSFTCTVR